LNPGRLAALRALSAVERGAHAEDVLAELAPSGVDRGLAWRLCLGVLRRQGSLGALLQPLLKKPLLRLDDPVRHALLIGAWEIKVGGTPEHAALSQAVELCRRGGAPHASGLVNAVLRRALALPLSDDPRLDLPPWLSERWGAHEAWLRRLRDPAVICGVWRKHPQPGLEVRALPGAPQGCFALPEGMGAVEALPGFAEGVFWVMDPAAAAVADLCGPVDGLDVLDACAAPGGKSLRLASQGARVQAVDLEPRRLARVEEAARRSRLPLSTRCHDWLRGPCPELGLYDVVLVDAPCSGLGTVRRHPEIKWRRMPTDPAAMALRQLPILSAAAAHLKPGGRLVYAVCSPEPEEGEEVVAQLRGWRVVERWSSWPPRGDEDAFQAFALVQGA
jgi:16S rRNA (cytosine967-C5)-methyltransferase